MAGAMFYRGQPVSEIDKMTFREMRYWYEWHEVMNKEERKIFNARNGNA